MTFRRIFAVGDVHGDWHSLSECLADMYGDGMDLTQDLLVQVGDIVDGGPQSNMCVEFLRMIQEEYPDNVVILLGNHEDLLLNAIGKRWYDNEFQLWWQQGGAETHRSYHGTYGNTARDGDTYKIRNITMSQGVEWMRNLPLSYETDDYIFVHAGLLPNMTLEGTPRHEKLWIREKFINSAYDWGKIVVYGHTARALIDIQTNKIGIDCKWHGDGVVLGVELLQGDGEERVIKQYGIL